MNAAPPTGGKERASPPAGHKANRHATHTPLIREGETCGRTPDAPTADTAGDEHGHLGIRRHGRVLTRADLQSCVSGYKLPTILNPGLSTSVPVIVLAAAGLSVAIRVATAPGEAVPLH